MKTGTALRLTEPSFQSGWRNKPDSSFLVEKAANRPRADFDDGDRDTFDRRTFHGATVTMMAARESKTTKPQLILSSQFATQFMGQYLAGYTRQPISPAIGDKLHHRYLAATAHNDTASTFDKTA